MRTLASFVLLLAAFSNVFAVSLYKCKTKDGTTIYQNDPCPRDSATVAQGAYQRQPDDTRTNRAAMNYSGQVHAERLQDEAAAAHRQAILNAQQPEPSSTAAWNAQVEALTRVGSAETDRFARKDRRQRGAPRRPQATDQ